jgi:hypothetical protein
LRREPNDAPITSHAARTGTARTHAAAAADKEIR